MRRLDRDVLDSERGPTDAGHYDFVRTRIQMEPPVTPRPRMVWVISLSLSLIAVAQMVLLTTLLWSDPLGPAGAAIGARLSTFDALALYSSAMMLLTAMICLFRMRKRAVCMLINYIGIGSWVAFWYAVTSTDHFRFDALASLGGVVALLIVLAYAISLKARGALA